MGESGSELFSSIPETRKFVELTILSADIRKPWLKATLKEIKNLINNQNFLVDEPEKAGPVTPCMDVNKESIQSGESLDKLRLIIFVRGDL